MSCLLGGVDFVRWEGTVVACLDSPLSLGVLALLALCCVFVFWDDLKKLIKK